ncbi:hypothetical protein DFH09DRAFT_1116849 [Mycena vulgaris]|nr:hypothetical protein DFH09DRAFT_1116849 [Mycena vulgaris]
MEDIVTPICVILIARKEKVMNTLAWLKKHNHLYRAVLQHERGGLLLLVILASSDAQECRNYLGAMSIGEFVKCRVGFLRHDVEAGGVIMRMRRFFSAHARRLRIPSPSLAISDAVVAPLTGILRQQFANESPCVRVMDMLHGPWGNTHAMCRCSGAQVAGSRLCVGSWFGLTFPASGAYIVEGNVRGSVQIPARIYPKVRFCTSGKDQIDPNLCAKLPGWLTERKGDATNNYAVLRVTLG